MESRKKKIDDTTREKKQQELRQVAPWLPSFTPEAATTIKVESVSACLFVFCFKWPVFAVF